MSAALLGRRRSKARPSRLQPSSSRRCWPRCTTCRRLALLEYAYVKAIKCKCWRRALGSSRVSALSAVPTAEWAYIQRHTSGLLGDTLSLHGG
eukprot:UN3290